MAYINYKKLAQMTRTLGVNETTQHLSEAMREGDLSPQDFSLRGLAEAYCGSEYVAACNPNSPDDGLIESMMRESAGANVLGQFGNITGQVVINSVLPSYEAQLNVATLFPTIKTNLEAGEKLAGIGSIGDQTQTVSELGSYKDSELSEEYVETPGLTKRGLLCSVSKEAIFHDRTGQLTRKAASVGESIGINREKRAVDLLINATNTWKRNGTTAATYDSTAGKVNTQSNPCTDWNDYNDALTLFSDMTHPDTNNSEPIFIQPTTVVCTPSKLATHRIINGATMTELVNNSATTGTARHMFAGTPSGTFRVVASQYMDIRVQSELTVSAVNAADYWYMLNPEKFGAYMEAWPLRVVQAPANNPLDFSNDIALQYKASIYDAYAVLEPRASVENTN